MADSGEKPTGNARKVSVSLTKSSTILELLYIILDNSFASLTEKLRLK